MMGLRDQRVWRMFSRVTILGSFPGLRISRRSSYIMARM